MTGKLHHVLPPPAPAVAEPVQRLVKHEQSEHIRVGFLSKEINILSFRSHLSLFSLVLKVHQSILPVRKGKDGWIDIICPGGVSCFDEGHFFSHVVNTVVFTLDNAL